jgi:radical SAM protein with 4Fe4S-binding SPASM domain
MAVDRALGTRSPVRTLHLDVDDRPFIVIWELTRACQLVCQHCRADAQHRRHPLELTTAEGRGLIDDLVAYGPPRPVLVLTGGDPFERPDLLDLIAHAAGGGLSVALAPSVTPRLTPEALSAARAAGASAVSLSIDGAVAATHDGFRGVAGVFEQTMAAAAAVRAAGLRLQLNTTVTQANRAELRDVLELVVGLGAGLWSVFFLVPTGRGRHVAALDAQEVEEVLHWLHEASAQVPIKTTEAPHFRRVVLQAEASGGNRPKRPPLDVNAGRGFVFVDHLGNVAPSGFLPEVVGSIRSQPLSTVYRTAPLLRALRDPDRLTGRCGRCEFRAVCGGSRSRAHAVFRDALAEDPACAYEPP